MRKRPLQTYKSRSWIKISDWTGNGTAPARFGKFPHPLAQISNKNLKKQKKMALNSSKFSALGFANIDLLLAVKRGEDASLL